MTTTTGVGWVCGKCGRGGLTSFTVLGGINLCALCVHEMQLAAKASPAVPLGGPGSHAWDLREMQAQRERADKAEAALAREKERADRAEKGGKILVAANTRHFDAARAATEEADIQRVRAVEAEARADRAESALRGVPCMFEWWGRRQGQAFRVPCDQMTDEPLPEHAWCPSCRARAALAGSSGGAR